MGNHISLYCRNKGPGSAQETSKLKQDAVVLLNRDREKNSEKERTQETQLSTEVLLPLSLLLWRIQILANCKIIFVFVNI